MKFRSIEYVIGFLAIAVSIAMIRLEPTAYSIDELNYKDATRLLSEGNIFTKDFIHAFIKLNDTYLPSQPIGYPIFSLPLYLLFRLEDKLVNKVQAYFLPGFYTAETDGITTFYWLENNGTIDIYSENNHLIKFGSSISAFDKVQEVNMTFQGENIFNNKVSTSPQFYETYFRAKKGWNRLNVNAGKCYPLKEIPDMDDYRCVSLAFANPKFEILTGKPYFDKNELYTLSVNEALEINTTNPYSFPIKVKAGFIAKSTSNSTLILQFGNEAYEFKLYNYPIEILTGFFQLEPNMNTMEFKIKNCEDCLVALSKLGINLEDDFYDEHFSYENGFFTEELQRNKKFRWAMSVANLKILSENKKAEFQFNVWSYFKPNKLRIYLNDKLVRTEEITTAPKNIKLNLDLKKGKNMIVFLTDSCYIPHLTENSQDYRCLSIGISEMRLE